MLLSFWESTDWLYSQIPKGKEVDDNDSFMFYDAFTAQLYRIKVRATKKMFANTIMTCAN